MPMQPATALNLLMTRPRAFLETYSLRVAGARVPSGIVQYSIRNRDFGTEGNPTQRPGKYFRTKSMYKTEGFYIDNLPQEHLFDAYSIAMAQSNAPVALYTLPANGGPNIMVTGVLSGCCFLIKRGAIAGSIECAHLQPNGESANDLNNRLVAEHTPNIIPLVKKYDAVYGRNNYGHLMDTQNPRSYDRNVTIIGVRRDQNWKVYAQKLDTIHSMSIRSVRRIYPK